MRLYLALCAALLLLAACDPCSGLGSCGEPRIRYEGQLRTPFGRPAIGVDVEFRSTGGVEIEGGTYRTVTDSLGRFFIEARALGDGQVRGVLTFRPPEPIPPTRIDSVSMATSRAPGELRQLGEWSVRYPYIAYKGFLFHRSTGRTPAKGIEIEFRRTGGIRVEPDSFVTRSDSLGYFLLRPAPSTVGEVVGDLTIRLLPPFEPIVMRGFTMRTFTEARGDTIFPVGIGYRFPFLAVLLWEDTKQPAADVRVEFRRTGGVQIYPDPYVTRTDPGGGFMLRATALSEGQVEGDFVAIPPGATAGTVLLKGARFRAVADDRPDQFIGYFYVPRPDGR